MEIDIQNIMIYEMPEYIDQSFYRNHRKLKTQKRKSGIRGVDRRPRKARVMSKQCIQCMRFRGNHCKYDKCIECRREIDKCINELFKDIKKDITVYDSLLQ